MVERRFRDYLEERGLHGKEIGFALRKAEEFERYLEKRKVSFKSAQLSELKDYVFYLTKKRRNSMNTLLAIARYCGFAKKKECLIYLVSILNVSDVLPEIGKRLATIAGKEVQGRVFEGFELPPLGSPPDSYPKLTKLIVDRLQAELPSETCRNVLTWNYHGIPAEAFKEKKERFEKAASIDEYLENEHRILVKELEGFMKEGRVWYEQEITPEVLDFVKGNQEICTGIRHGDTIHVTKIPYAPREYLKERAPVMKRYYACHCALVRTSIRDGKPGIPPVFCYCSSGFEKVAFDAVFGESVNVELLESILKGDLRCRFAIKIPEKLSKLKK